MKSKLISKVLMGVDMDILLFTIHKMLEKNVSALHVIKPMAGLFHILGDDISKRKFDIDGYSHLRHKFIDYYKEWQELISTEEKEEYFDRLLEFLTTCFGIDPMAEEKTEKEKSCDRDWETCC